MNIEVIDKLLLAIAAKEKEAATKKVVVESHCRELRHLNEQRGMLQERLIDAEALYARLMNGGVYDYAKNKWTAEEPMTPDEAEKTAKHLDPETILSNWQKERGHL